MPYTIPMRFRTRLIITYSLVGTILISLTAFIFELYNLKHMETLARQDLAVLSKNMSHQLDEIVRPMVFITEFLLSDNRVLSAVTTLARAERNVVVVGQPFITQAKQEIKTALSTYCNNVNFHRVSFFNEYGDILSSNLQAPTIPDGSAIINWVPGIGRADTAMGRAILLPAYSDPWDYREPRRVFGVIRLIMGNNSAAYIEVQKPESVMEDLYRLGGAGAVAVITGGGELFYSQCDGRVTGILLSLAAGPGLTEQAINQVDGSIAASYYSAYTDTYTIVVQGRETLIAAIKDITAVTIIMALFIWVILVAVIGLLSLRVTAPIGQLIARIEQTNLDNIDHDAAIEYKYTDDELVHLRDSYNQLLKRLNHARRQEEQMSLLHLQAEFDALQAQVNPHFIYNVLNVISHRGVLNKDEVICEICEKLASMLRYAGGTSQRLVSVREELDYLEGYLYLLKTRYRDKLEYTIDVEEAVLGQRIPKIALQQFIENSITHGFNNSARIMALSVRGWAAEGRWYIEVRDNGGGFSETGKAALEKQMEAVKKRVREANLNLDIGGMGLLNLYARFLLLFGDAVIFRLANRGGPSGNGAVVTIGVPMSREQFQAAEPGITKCTG